ncbi:hypothetical protein GC176_28245 [bacterium]|nr:hypothetical protein [bacterium]
MYNQDTDSLSDMRNYVSEECAATVSLVPVPVTEPGRSFQTAWPRPGLWKVVEDRLGPRELKRRVWHMTPGLLAFSLWVTPHADPLTTGWLIYIAMHCIPLALAGCYWGRTFTRPQERNCVCSAVSYCAIVLTAILLFPGQPELGMAVLAIIAFGDGSATLGGLLLKGPTLPWNHQKTWVGSLCFLLGSVPMATIIYWGEARPGVSWDVALLCSGAAALVSGIVESLPSRINDNIRVGLTAFVMLVVMNQLLLGWS